MQINPFGLLSLLAIPILLAIYFLQRKAKKLPITTLFLLQRNSPRSKSGNRFERLLHTPPLWLQLLALCLLVWLLLQPRYTQKDEIKRVAVVVDASASMSAFIGKGTRAIQDLVNPSLSQNRKFHYTLLSTQSTVNAIYRGSDFPSFLQALENFEPTSSSHDPTPSLQLARSILGDNGNLIFLTDTPPKQTNYNALTLSVGSPLKNVGFTGLSFSGENGKTNLTALLRNYADTPQTRNWSIINSTGKSTPREIKLGPLATQKIQLTLPNKANLIRLKLNKDEFPLDDTLPVIFPEPKKITFTADDTNGMSHLAKKLSRSIQNTVFQNLDANPDIRITSSPPVNLSELTAAHQITFSPAASPNNKLLTGTLVTETHPLINGTNWQGLFIKETPPQTNLPNDTVLLWQASRPLIFHRHINGFQSLHFNFNYLDSNIAQLPAFIILLHRFTENIRSQKIAPESRNLETNQNFNLASNPSSPLEILALNVNGNPKPAANLQTALQTPGFLRVQQNDNLLLNAAIHFADAREANFTQCSPAPLELAEFQQQIEQTSSADPLTRIWILLALMAVSIAWWLPARQDLPREDAQNAFSS